jgi:hypothetical protein
MVQPLIFAQSVCERLLQTAGVPVHALPVQTHSAGGCPTPSPFCASHCACVRLAHGVGTPRHCGVAVQPTQALQLPSAAAQLAQPLDWYVGVPTHVPALAVHPWHRVVHCEP